MEIFGHRGASGTEPENTLRAFRAALAAGVAGVELDARLTVDGHVVVIHDHDVSRTTTGTGMVSDLTLAEIHAFDAGAGEVIPTLPDVLDLLAGRLVVDVEIKQSGIERVVLDVLAAYPAATWFISCFDWDVLRQVRRLRPEAPVWPLAMAADDALVAVAAELAAPGIALYHGAYQPEAAARLASAGPRVGVWTVNDVNEARRVRALGADILMTDYPERMISALHGG